VRVESEPTDPVTHFIAMRMAQKFVDIISGILMECERAEALRQAYQVARWGLESYDRKEGIKLR